MSWGKKNFGPKGRGLPGVTSKRTNRMIWRSADQIDAKFYLMIGRGSALNLFERNSVIEENWSPRNFWKRVDYVKISNFFIHQKIADVFWQHCLAYFYEQNSVWQVDLDLYFQDQIVHFLKNLWTLISRKRFDIQGRNFTVFSPRSRVIRQRKKISLYR